MLKSILCCSITFSARFINAVLDEVVRLGDSYNGNFKKANWNRIVRAFNDGLLTGQTRDRKQLQSKIAELKKKYRTYAAMKANSGFGWDPTTGMPTAPDSVWDDLIAVYPQAKEFKSRPLFMYHELDIIMSRTAATGAFAVYDEHIISLARPAPSSLSGLSNDSGDEVLDTSKADSLPARTKQLKSKDMFTDEVPVHQRFRFIKLLATQPNAATMFYGMDDESRRYMVEQYLLTDNSDSD
ncbi:uncharacterized protein PITG_06571 [Phytophthora infestans T30-4]|uniref:Myb/SANT-like domain-containing protein n=1 Tax=Phytophthora infestans (strain T30-4) TaxID=403677 RepID=D0N559_PHYIT|nr:uncharacterized protein PITG_06571 [Phytophthora infestans T30-4]EEY70017.1 hypothetical protein PITG_06571 [Phytophthora infestans T30-4]|eukprot:XP_002998664.1 hypothetical protein PITG_06571 [Phytophthora infestans T30-4]